MPRSPGQDAGDEIILESAGQRLKSSPSAATYDDSAHRLDKGRSDACVAGISAVFHRRWQCEICRSRFLMSSRRHHCRGCGLSVCSSHFIRPLCIICSGGVRQTPSAMQDRQHQERNGDACHASIRSTYPARPEQERQGSAREAPIRCRISLSGAQNDSLADLRHLTAFALCLVVLFSVVSHGAAVAALVCVSGWLGAVFSWATPETSQNQKRHSFDASTTPRFPRPVLEHSANLRGCCSASCGQSSVDGVPEMVTLAATGSMRGADETARGVPTSACASATGIQTTPRCMADFDDVAQIRGCGQQRPICATVGLGGTHGRESRDLEGEGKGGGQNYGGQNDEGPVSKLRARAEAEWLGVGRGLPAALDDELYLRGLLNRRGRDERWAVSKLVAAVAWRRKEARRAADVVRNEPSCGNQGSDGHQSTKIRMPLGAGVAGRYRSGDVAHGGDDGACLPRLAGHSHDPTDAFSGDELGELEHPHGLVAALAHVAPLLSPCEPLLSDAALAEAGRVLRDGVIYWHGTDCRGWPVLWCHTGRLDLRLLGRQGEPDAAAWGRAVACIVELGIVAARARAQRRSLEAVATRASAAEAPAQATSLRGRQASNSLLRTSGSRAHEPPKFMYVESTRGLSVSKLPIRNMLRVAHASLGALLRSAPERLGTIAVAPTLKFNRIIDKIMRPFLPESVRTRLHLFAREEQMRVFLTRELGDESKVPSFFGGTAEHKVHYTPEGNLDLLAMMSAIVDED
uniref:FYVE-type domain-containing protein n=1 Tax=Chrysotila carterae TaxID=13221 RepID=A0A7S4C2E4_CHRCT